MRPDLLPKTFDGKMAKVMEECGEVLQAMGKVQRHGLVAFDHGSSETPISPPRCYHNGADLLREMDELHDAMVVLAQELQVRLAP